MEELFRLEWVQLLLLVVGSLVLFFLVLLAIGSVVSVIPERSIGKSADRGDSHDLDDDRWTIRPGRIQLGGSRQAKAAVPPPVHDMLTGEPLQRAVDLRLLGASRRVFRLTVSPATALAVHQRGLVCVEHVFRRHVERLLQSGSYVTVGGPSGSLQVDPRDWYNELMSGVPSLPALLAAEQAVQQLPPAVQPVGLLSAYVDEDDDDDEVTNPRINTDDLLREYLDTENTAAESANQRTYRQEIEELPDALLEFSNGMDERGVMLRDGIPVGCSLRAYDCIEISEPTPQVLAEIYEAVHEPAEVFVSHELTEDQHQLLNNVLAVSPTTVIEA